MQIIKYKKILEKYYDDSIAVINHYVKTFFELPNCPNASATSIEDLLKKIKVKLVNAKLSECLNIVKNLNLCPNWLRSNHSVKNCNASMCKTCKKRHHTLLHRYDNTKISTQINLASLHSATPSQVLISTAIIQVLDYEGNSHKCRALLDNSSQVHFVTEKLATKLGLRQRELEIPLGGVNQMSSSVSKITNSTIQSRFNKYSACITSLITSIITWFCK